MRRDLKCTTERCIPKNHRKVWQNRHCKQQCRDRG
uniref:Uncharacterized protein n=1 Tax=Anguilla anguilla TaxID=7936 RepID=A0A0E9XQ21_ANGAN